MAETPLGYLIPRTPDVPEKRDLKRAKKIITKPKQDTPRAHSWPASLRRPGLAPKEERVRRPSEISQAFKGKRLGTGTRTRRTP